MDRLILWDIDGTLVSVGDIGAEVFDRALERALGRRPPGRVRMSGKTDPQIVGEYLAMLGIADPEAQLACVLEQLEKQLAAAEDEIRSGGRVLPGVVEVIDRLAAHPGVAQTVLTGNIAPNALLKLAAFGLDSRVDLEVGAFGSDHADRTKLVPIARSRVATMRGRDFQPEQIWVVGDSANDLACARAGGVRCMLVATGRFALDELAPLDADVTLGDLTDTDRVMEILLS